MRPILAPITDSDSPKSRRAYSVVQDAAFVLGVRRVIVPAGFEWDGASIPPMLWPVIGSPFEPEFMAAALLHDWLYSTHLLPRDMADDAFHELLRAHGVGKWRAWSMYQAVRMAGSMAWRDSDEDKAYMDFLRARIAASGRSLSEYGL